MGYQTILVERRGAIELVTLNRPEVRNAQNSALILELDEAMHAADDDPENPELRLTPEGVPRTTGGGALPLGGGVVGTVAEPGGGSATVTLLLALFDRSDATKVDPSPLAPLRRVST